MQFQRPKDPADGINGASILQFSETVSNRPNTHVWRRAAKNLCDGGVFAEEGGKEMEEDCPSRTRLLENGC